jgi:hypothetical protein
MNKPILFLIHERPARLITRLKLLVIICLSTILHLQAQIPQAFKYQAVARNSSGAILSNQNVSFRMSIIQGALPGTIVYSEKHVTTTNEFGLATLEIGRGTVYSGSFSTIDWSVTPTWIKTEMDPAGGVSFINMGTAELLGVPYAMQAGSAPDEDWVVSGVNLYPGVTGRVGIGNTSPTQKLHVTGNMRLTGALYDTNNETGTSGEVLSSTGSGVDWITNPAVTGSGVATRIPFWSGTGTLSSDASLNWEPVNHRLGIGTNTPQKSFHLFNGAGAGGGAYDPNIDALIEDDDWAYLEFNAAYFAGITFNDDNASVRAGVFYNYWNDEIMFRTGSQDGRMVIDEAGNVGIGISPTQKLHVNGSMRLTGALWDMNNQTGSSGQVLSSTGSGTDWISMPTGSGAANKTAFWTGANTLGYNNNYHWDNTNSRLGLGTATPAANFHLYNGPGGGGGAYNSNIDAIIEDDVNAYLEFNGVNYAGITFNDDAASIRAAITYNYGLDALTFRTGGVDNRMVIDEEGNVGIGAYTPSYKLSVGETGESTTVYISNSNNANGSSALYVNHTAAGANNGVTAVYGRASGNNQPNSYGLAGHNYYSGIGVGAWSYSGDLMRAYDGDWPGGTLRFYITQAGNMYIDGTYNTFKGLASKGPNKHVALTALQCPEALIEDCGSAELVNGSAWVKIDETFAEIANTGVNYQVFLTPVSDVPVIMSVSNKASSSFMVKGYLLNGTPATCPFDYRIVARDNESKGGRFEEVDIPEPIIVPREE